MPPAKLELEKKSSGRYHTAGLDSKQFMQAFEKIRKQNAKTRRSAKRTITPSVLKQKGTKDLARLGKKEDGSNFTREDLLALEKSKKDFERKYDRKTAGISYAQIVSASRSIDIKRANNQVTDGSGITTAHVVAIKANVVKFRVKASLKNGDDDHMVNIRIESWDDCMQNAEVSTKGYQKATAKAVRDRLSLSCDCGRHQYWYRYLATIGNYCVAPPKEFSPPKVRNPNFTGVACKHVLHVVNKLQSPTWANQLAIQMKKQASKTGYGDDSRSNHIFSDEDIKKQSKTRKGKIDHKAMQAEFKKYEKRQAALGNKLKRDKKEIDKLRKGMTKRLGQLEKAKRQVAKEKKSKGDLIRFSFPMFKDTNKDKNWSDTELRTQFSKQTGINIKVVGAVLDDK